MCLFKFFFFCSLILFLSCTNEKKSQTNEDWNSHDQKLKDLDENMQDISAKIKAAVGKGKCREDSQCRVLGLGAIACEGYSNFIVFSTLDASETEITQLVDEFNGEDEKYNQISMKVLKCGEKPLPPHCINNVCTVKK